MKTEAMILTENGGPENFKWQTIELPELGAEEVRIRHTAVGLNFIDVYHRTGLYPMPLPGSVGIEGVGVIEAVGADVRSLEIGTRVGYPASNVGAYQRHRNIHMDFLVSLPDYVSDQLAAAVLTKGCTVEFLTRRLKRLEPGDTVLWHAAAGGVGLIACQWLKALGVRMIGTVGSDKKAEIAAAHGCPNIINYREENVVERVREITDGYGVTVAYDGVGKDTYQTTLDCLAPRGLFVSFGNATGPLDPIDPKELAGRGSLMFTRPSLGHYVSERSELIHSTTSLFMAISRGEVKPTLNQIFALEHAAQAHLALEARATSGQTILLPEL